MPGRAGRLGPGAGGWLITRRTILLWIALTVFVLWRVGLLQSWVNPTAIGGGPVEHALEGARAAPGASGKGGVAPQGASGQVRICTTVAECVNTR
jgi:hypothetical protein